MGGQFVLTFRMRTVVPIWGGSNQSTMSKYYPITTRLRNLLTLPPPFMRTVFLDGVRNSIFSTFNQKSSNKAMTYDLPWCPPSMQTACELRICSSWRTELKIFNIQSEQPQERDDNSRPSVRTACELWRVLLKAGIPECRILKGGILKPGITKIKHRTDKAWFTPTQT